MRRFLTSIAVISTIAVCGCVPSLHAFFTPADVTYDEELLGTWSDDSSTWVFSRNGKTKTYNLVVDVVEGKERKTKRAEFNATLFRLKGQLYVDLYPVREPAGNSISFLSQMHLLPAHTLSKCDRKKGSLTISMMSSEWAEKRLKANPDEVAHTIVKNTLVFTASTKDLQGFVNKHRGKAGAFGVFVTLEKK